jgi:hypothetical protein
MTRIGVLAIGIIVASLVVTASGCGGSGKKSEADEQDAALGKEVQAACKGKPLTAAPKLPASFPQIEADKLTYTRQSTEGPTNVVEGYFHGDVKAAHDEFLKELKGAQFKILFNELEEHDSEISWQGEGRTGQVAMREECGSRDKTYVHITNRAA